MKKHLSLSIVGLLLMASTSFAQQDKSKRPSPPAQAQCKFQDGKSIKVDYSSPRAKGRKVFGELVPFGEVWRTGANEATSFVTDTDLTIGGKPVPAGSYTIFTVPNADKWTLIINKKTGEWGIPYKYEGDELLRTDMTVAKTPGAVENFTITLDPQDGGCVMKVSWENTQASATFAEKK